MKRILSLLLPCFCLLHVYALKEYTPDYLHPLKEPWRWRQISNFENNNFVDFTLDSNKVLWAVFQDSSNILRSYDGYAWQDYPIKNLELAGLVVGVTAISDSIIINCKYDLIGFHEGRYSRLLNQGLEEKHRVQIYAVHSVWDTCFVALTNYGFLFKRKNQWYFYTEPRYEKAFQQRFPHFNVLCLPNEAIPAEKVSNYMIKLLAEVNSNQFWLFPRFKERMILIVENTGDTAKPLKIKRKPKSNGIPRFRFNAKIVRLGNEYWIISAVKDNKITVYSDSEWKLLKPNAPWDMMNGYYSIVKMPDGHILIGSKGAIIDYYNGKFQIINNTKATSRFLSPINFLRTPGGNLIVSNQFNMYIVDYNNYSWESYNNLVFQQETNDGSKWFISKDNQIVQHVDSKWIAYDETDGLIDAPLTVKVNSKGEVWCAGSHRQGAAFAYLKGNKWYKAVFDTMAVNFSQTSGFEDSEGNMWFGSARRTLPNKTGGVVRAKITNNGSLEIETYKTPRYIKAGFSILPNGSMAAFTPYNMFAYNKEQNNWVEFKDIAINSIAKTLDGNFWAVVKGRGFYPVANNSGIDDIPAYIANNRYSHVHISNKILWLVSNEDIKAFNGKNWVQNAVSPQFNVMINKIQIAGKNSPNTWLNMYPEGWISRALFNGSYYLKDSLMTIKIIADTLAPRMTMLQHSPTVDHNGNITVNWLGSDHYNCTMPDNLMYSYQLNNREWSEFDNKTSHTFLSLRPGMHSLRVRCMDNQFNISTKSISTQFTVLTPVYLRSWFITLIILLAATIVTLGIRGIKKNRKLRFLNQQLESANELLKEQQQEIISQQDKIYRSKLNFFTYISHEFRTPLTLILGPLKNLINSLEKEENKKHAKLVQKSANQLLKLVSEIMDFRKLEDGHMQLGAQETEIISYCKEIIDAYSEMAVRKKIDYRIETTSHRQVLWVDRNKFTKIIHNLISNAFKNTPEGGYIKIIFSAKELPLNPQLKNKLEIRDITNPLSDFFEITIEDSGIGIPKESIASIFNNFYQVHENDIHISSGIGLALTKELVLLHKGELIVQSNINVGSCFTLRLPIGKEHISAKYLITKATNEKLIKSHHSSNTKNVEVNTPVRERIEKQTVLVVDDNADIREYIAHGLKKYYTILEAEDGKLGWKSVIKHLPDMIITDVMMPKINGLELCQLIKSHIRTSHIPVIMLSARSSNQHQMEGLQQGADVYIAKPFDLDLLSKQIANLIYCRNQLVEKVKVKSLFTLDGLSYNSLDEQFIKDVHKQFMENYTNTEFKIESVCNNLGIGIRNMQKKLKSLIGMTPIELLKSMRVQYAEQLLEKTDYNVNEIAFMSGFNNVGYFHRLFKEKHDCSPLQYSEKFKNKEDNYSI
ncbi:MAG: response regulator [Bacteroidales bacterium]|nr:response regulator [Bacteroidales bacterium]